jgi:hypothetical protein
MTLAPQTDLVAHEDSDSCTCGPVAIPIVSGEGERFHLTAHRRLDGLPVLPYRPPAVVAPVAPARAPRMLDRRDWQVHLVWLIFAVAALLGLALM